MKTNHQMNYYDYGKTLDIQGVMTVIGGGVEPQPTPTPTTGEFLRFTNRGNGDCKIFIRRNSNWSLLEGLNLQYRTDEEGDWNEYDNVYTMIEPDVYYYIVDFEYVEDGEPHGDSTYVNSDELASYEFDKDNPNPSILAYLQENYTNPTIIEVINTTKYYYAGYKITLTPDDYVEFKGINPNGIQEFDESGEEDLKVLYQFYVEHDDEDNLEIYASGDITSIINGVGGDTGVAAQDYSSLFNHCTWLVSPPNLPDTVLSSSCYRYLFIGCTSLTTAPELPATIMAKKCYEYMFFNCTSLTEAPELPATTLAEECYFEMFAGCSNLTEAPILPATTLAEDCYYGMFKDCTSLNYVKCLSNDDMSNQNDEVGIWLYTEEWLENVSKSGTFVRSSGNTSWETNINGIPYGWDVEEELL